MTKIEIKRLKVMASLALHKINAVKPLLGKILVTKEGLVATNGHVCLLDPSFKITGDVNFEIDAVLCTLIKDAKTIELQHFEISNIVRIIIDDSDHELLTNRSYPAWENLFRAPRKMYKEFQINFGNIAPRFDFIQVVDNVVTYFAKGEGYTPVTQKQVIVSEYPIKLDISYVKMLESFFEGTKFKITCSDGEYAPIYFLEQEVYPRLEALLMPTKIKEVK